MNTKAGEEALNYLIDRGITEESIETFKIGFSPPKREALKMYLENENLSETDILKKSGLFLIGTMINFMIGSPIVSCFL